MKKVEFHEFHHVLREFIEENFPKAELRIAAGGDYVQDVIMELRLGEKNYRYSPYILYQKGMSRGGKGAMDYAMAAVLGGCNQITEASPKYQINYYTYDVATQDASKKKEDGKLGATWTWSSNCRKVIGIDGAGQIPKEINTYFYNLPETTTLGEIEQWFKEGQIEAFQTKKNDMVMSAVQQLIVFMEKMK